MNTNKIKAKDFIITAIFAVVNSVGAAFIRSESPAQHDKYLAKSSVQIHLSNVMLKKYFIKAGIV